MKQLADKIVFGSSIALLLLAIGILIYLNIRGASQRIKGVPVATSPGWFGYAGFFKSSNIYLMLDTMKTLGPLFQFTAGSGHNVLVIGDSKLAKLALRDIKGKGL